MFSTELFTAAAALVVALGAIAVAIRAARYAHQVQKWAATAADPVGRRQIADLAAGHTELSDAYDALLTSHKKLSARIRMREHRGNGKLPADDLDIATTTDKAALRLQLRKRGLL